MDRLHERMMAWVREGYREDWGERWEMAARVVLRYDPARTPLEPYLAFCWRRRLIDRGRKVSMTPAMQFTEEIDFASNPPPVGVLEEAAQFADAPEEFAMAARGVFLRHIALVLHKPLGSVKSTMNHYRAKVRRRVAV